VGQRIGSAALVADGLHARTDGFTSLAVLLGVGGVLDVGQVRLRWIGHHLRAECEVVVDAGAAVVRAHQVAVDAEHNLLHALPRLAAALVHADPQAQEGTDHHAVLASHR